MHPQIATYIREVSALDARARKLADTLSDEEFTRSMKKGQWNVAQCVEHLVTIGEPLLPRLKDAVHVARIDGKIAQGPYNPGILSKFMAWMMEPPYRIKAKTQDVFVPTSTFDKSMTLKRYEEWHRNFTQFLKNCDGIAIDTIRVPSVANDSVKLPVSGWIPFLLAHERRHLWQAERIAEFLGKK